MLLKLVIVTEQGFIERNIGQILSRVPALVSEVQAEGDRNLKLINSIFYDLYTLRMFNVYLKIEQKLTKATAWFQTSSGSKLVSI